MAEYIARNPKTYEGTLTAGVSPLTLDVKGDSDPIEGQPANAHNGYISNDTSASFKVELSRNGTDFGDETTIKGNEIYTLEKKDIAKIRLTRITTDIAYRIEVT